MLRYVPLAIWFALTVAFLAMSFSQFLFGARDWRRLGRKLGLSLVWPFALLSSAGRRILLDEGRDL